MAKKLPDKKKIERAITDALTKNKSLSNAQLLTVAARGLGLKDEDFGDSSPNSVLTVYKSLIGTVLKGMLEEDKVTLADKQYSLPVPAKKKAARPAVRPAAKKKQPSFESITHAATELYDRLVGETQTLREKYIAELKKSLRMCLAVCSSEFFEEVSVKLVCLVCNVPFENGSVTGGSDDGGIDGVVRITDDLGFDRDVIYIQSKCRTDIGNISTATEVRSFWGAASKKDARKAVFVTNGKMHPDAVKEATDNRSLRFIEGDRLADLMIKYRLGVKYIDGLPVIDESFFPIVH